ncbi:MAG TPA: CHAT domain-containing tetratricopeptide repeat protein [Bryobacteraceae bacterium]|nr:CHAT domain-containing tetratricopeptide repeat protein [Bryobacteraceae bacterium]
MRHFLAVVSLCAAALAQAPPQDTSAALAARAEQQYARSDYKGAIATLKQAIAAAEREQGAQSVAVGDLWFRLNDACFILGKYQEGDDAAGRALAIYRQQPGSDSRVARATAAIALQAAGAGDYSKSVSYYQQAIALLERGSPPDPELAPILAQYASALLRSGEYGPAQLTAERAVASFESTGRGDTAECATALQVLVNVLNEIGDYSAADRQAQRALAIVEKTSGADSVLAANILVVLGSTAQNERAYGRSKSLLEQAAAIYAKRLGRRNTRVAGAMDNLGQTLLLMKDYAAAQTAFRRALDIQDEALGPRSAWAGNLIQGLAKVAAATGRYEEARRLYEQNLDIWREQLGPAHPFTIASLGQLAEVQARLGKRSQAIATALEDARIRRDSFTSTIAAMDERQALRYATVRLAGLEAALSLAPGASAAEQRDIFDELIRNRGLVFDEMAGRHRALLNSDDPGLTKAAADLADLRSALARLVVQGRGRLSETDYERRLDEARARTHEAEEALALRSGPFRSRLARQRAGLAEVRAALPPKSLLIAYVRYDAIDSARAGAAAIPSYAAFLLRPGAEGPRVVFIGRASRVDALVRHWCAEIDRERTSLGRNAARNEAMYRNAAWALEHVILDPARPEMASARQVFIVPDGSLEAVNFMALPAGHSRYLVQSGPSMNLLTAERDLIPREAATSGEGLLAIGNPDFQSRNPGERTAISGVRFRGSRSECEDFSAIEFEPLPGAAAETLDVARVWKSRGWPADRITGSEATEAALRERSAGKRVVHLATHAFFLPAECRQSAVVRENPLLRAGLALAGANRRSRAAADQDDGILTAEEAASLDLHAADLVVLSGCDTGAGDIQSGEGVLGLRRAFEEAGARTVITSLWPVDDDDARQWMTELYADRFRRGMPTGEAVRAASRHALALSQSRHGNTHPFHWAGFTSVGDWR